MSSTNPVAIVTGGSRGIGAALCRRLGEDGVSVVVNYAHGKDKADEVVADIEKAGSRAVAAQADITADGAIPGLFDAAERAFGTVDILINSAGVMPLAPIAEFTDELFDQAFALNFRATFHGMREGAKRIADGGRIISFSTSQVGLLHPTYGIYAANKAAIETMTHVLAKELGPRRITVNTVAPGPVESELFFNANSPERVEQTIKMNPFGRLGKPEDIARLVSFLASAEAGWINGQVIRANGGVA